MKPHLTFNQTPTKAEKAGWLNRAARCALVWGALVVALATGPMAMAADAANTANSADDDAAIADFIRSFSDAHFSVPDDLAVSAELRDQARQLSQAHRLRISQVISTWIAEARAGAQTPPSPRLLTYRVLARHYNSLALWWLDSAGEASDQRWLQALQTPGLCMATGDLQPFAAKVMQIQHMPTEWQTMAWRDLEDSLARWGKPAATPERPTPSLRTGSEAVVTAMRGPKRPPEEPPMPPMLAWLTLTTTPRTWNATAHCLLAQWALQRRALSDLLPSQRLALAHYALLEPLVEDLQQRAARNAQSSDYPPLAHVFEITGTVQVRGRPRATGQGLTDARVVGRQIHVPGLNDARPVFFETVLDAASLERAQRTVTNARDTDKDASLVFKWQLD